jgi:hypothetical protein
MTDRRSFFARVLGGAAASAAVASGEALVVLPEQEPVRLYSRVPEMGGFMSRTNYSSESMWTAQDANAIGMDIRELSGHVNRLNAVVFGVKNGGQ